MFAAITSFINLQIGQQSDRPRNGLASTHGTQAFAPSRFVSRLGNAFENGNLKADSPVKAHRLPGLSVCVWHPRPGLE